jgi:hypothetical protein
MEMKQSGYYTAAAPIVRQTREFGASAGIGVLASALCFGFLRHFQLGGADFNWAQRAAQDLLFGVDPYSHPSPGVVPYPLPAALIGLPFVGLTPEVAGALFFGVSSCLLALGLIRQSPQRLLIFLAYPFWAALMTAQWTPLLMSAAFFPVLWPVSLAKPQIGGPVALTHLSKKGVIAGGVLLLASFVLSPRWVVEWVSQLSGYQYFVPLLMLPGTLLFLALLRNRGRDALLLVLFAAMPQRWFYDAFVLWLIPKTRREILGAVAISWGVGIWRWFHMPHSIRQVGLWSILGFYLPMLVVVLLRRDSRGAQSGGARLSGNRDR